MSGSASGFILVAIGAALWGSDALFRRGLAQELPSSVVVAGEHLILTVVLLPILWRSRSALGRLRWSDWLSLAVIGAGSSALATVLFTSAFRYGDPNTPLLLQKLQPIFAMLGAAIVLKERIQPRFIYFAATALTGGFLITFPGPSALTPERLAPALLAAGAALLWGLGTVLGRRLTPVLRSSQITSLRVSIGLIVLAPLVAIQTGVGKSSRMISDSFGSLILLALIPGLIALLFYYRGLQETPASAASLAELAFPLTAIGINYLAFDAVLTGSQWLGISLLSGTIVVMAWVGRGSHGSLRLGIKTDPAAVASPAVGGPR